MARPARHDLCRDPTPAGRSGVGAGCRQAALACQPAATRSPARCTALRRLDGLCSVAEHDRHRQAFALPLEARRPAAGRVQQLVSETRRRRGQASGNFKTSRFAPASASCCEAEGSGAGRTRLRPAAPTPASGRSWWWNKSGKQPRRYSLLMRLRGQRRRTTLTLLFIWPPATPIPFSTGSAGQRQGSRSGSVAEGRCRQFCRGSRNLGRAHICLHECVDDRDRAGDTEVGPTGSSSSASGGGFAGR